MAEWLYSLDVRGVFHSLFGLTSDFLTVDMPFRHPHHETHDYPSERPRKAGLSEPSHPVPGLLPGDFF